MRGSDPDATIYWLARMIDAGEDPKFIARRIMIHASEDVKEEWNKKIPLRRGGTPEEIAKVALFLGSDLSSYVSGQVIEVNGAMNS